MRVSGVNAAIARYREAGTKKKLRAIGIAVHLGSAYYGVLLYHH